VPAVLGRLAVVAHLHLLPGSGGAQVARLTLADGRRLVLKAVGTGDDQPVDFQRTAAVTALARAAGVLTPAVLAVDESGRAGWRYLLREYLDGVPWRQVRPQLDVSQVEAAHQQIAAAVVSLQRVQFNSFGELDQAGRPQGLSLVDALHGRANLRIADPAARTRFHQLLDRDAGLFTDPQQPTLCHDDLHHDNVLFSRRGRVWELAGILDWDKAWAGPAESDLARMAFWDDMTGPGFWQVYRSAMPSTDGQARRSLIYQLLWCLEYADASARHAADTAALVCKLATE